MLQTGISQVDQRVRICPKGTNGKWVCYHPIFVFNQFGDCEGAMLRPGNVHSADNRRQVLYPILARYERTGVRRYFRADAAFAKPEVYEYLAERRDVYAIRLPSNEMLQWQNSSNRDHCRRGAQGGVSGLSGLEPSPKERRS